MKRDETTLEKTAEKRCINAKRCETCEQMTRQHNIFIDGLETGVKSFWTLNGHSTRQVQEVPKRVKHERRTRRMDNNTDSIMVSG